MRSNNVNVEVEVNTSLLNFFLKGKCEKDHKLPEENKSYICSQNKSE